jgi:prepilin-type N-terminal cleavage/methylation domain-containing protein/prepilin-type processing-associated H-X9-DG protein
MSDAAFPYCITRAPVQENFRNGRGARFAQYRRPATLLAVGTPTRPYRRAGGGFTLIELLVVIAIIAILAAILFPIFGNAKEAGRRVRCAAQLKQLIEANLAYADDNLGRFVPAASDISRANLHRWHGVRTATDRDFDPAKGPLWTYLGRSGGIKKCPLLPLLKGKAQARNAAYESGCGGYGYNYLYVGGTYYRNNQTDAQKIASATGDLASTSRTVMFTDAAMASVSRGAVVLVEESFAYPPFLVSTDSSGNQSSTTSSPSIHFRHAGRAVVGWCDGHVTSEPMSCSLDDPNAYGVDSRSYNLGWFGPYDNSLFDNK